MFAGSNWDADDYDDWCVIQRDLRVDAGLLPAREEEVVAARNKAAKAIQALFRELGLPEITDEEFEAAKAVHERKGRYYMTLYKQAGNSIAVPIFESIFRKIILGEEKTKKDDSERQKGDAGR